MKKDHRPEVAGYTAVVQTVFADLERYGCKVPPDALAALNTVNSWLDGNEIDAAALQSAANLSFQDGVSLAEREKDRAMSWARTAAGNLAWLAKKDRGWQNAGTTIMDAAVYTLSSLNIAGVKDGDQLEAVRMAAMATAKPDKAAAPKKAAKKISTDLSAFIGVAANKYLAKLKPVFDLATRGSEADLRTLLAQHEYFAHDAVLIFETRYGGLVAADQAGEEGNDWIFGAYACLKSKAHRNPRGKDAKWVPVAYSPNDYIFFLDEDGVAWSVDTIGDSSPERFADDADAMMGRIFRNDG